MDLHEVLERRASIRAFTPEPVPPATLERVLRAALASPSWANTQPYRLAVATDAACDALRQALLAAGVFLQSLLLAAAAEGLGTCAQASLASYPQVVRRHFEVPDGYCLLCGISIGWPAEAPENRFHPGRMRMEELLVPVRADGKS